MPNITSVCAANIHRQKNGGLDSVCICWLQELPTLIPVYLAACTTSNADIHRWTWRPVSRRRPALDLSHYVLARRTSFNSRLCPERVCTNSAEKLGTLVLTIEKKSTDISVSSHAYIMNYIHRSMWNSALGDWEDDAAIAGQLGASLSIRQTNLNRVEALKNSSRLLLISLFFFPMWMNATNVSRQTFNGTQIRYLSVQPKPNRLSWRARVYHDCNFILEWLY